MIHQCIQLHFLWHSSFVIAVNCTETKSKFNIKNNYYGRDSLWHWYYIGSTCYIITTSLQLLYSHISQGTAYCCQAEISPSSWGRWGERGYAVPHWPSPERHNPFRVNNYNNPFRVNKLQPIQGQQLQQPIQGQQLQPIQGQQLQQANQGQQITTHSGSSITTTHSRSKHLWNKQHAKITNAF